MLVAASTVQGLQIDTSPGLPEASVGDGGGSGSTSDPAGSSGEDHGTGPDAGEATDEPTSSDPSSDDATLSAPDLSWPVAAVLPAAALALGVSAASLRGGGEDEEGGFEAEPAAPEGPAEPEGAAPGDDGAASSAAEPSPGPADPGRFLRFAEQAADAGEVDHAVEWFEAALALDPDIVPAWIGKGLCLEETGRYEDAAEAFHRAAELDPQGADPRYLQARAEAQAGDTGQALRRLRPLVEDHPQLGQAARDDRRFRGLHDDPRFLAALGEL